MSLDLADPLAAFRLDGQVAAVTGGASGIGRAVCQAFAKVGAKVAVLDRDGEGAAGVARAIAGAEAHALDVTDEAAVDAVFAAIVRAHGRIDVLVNSAGIAVREAAVELSLKDFERVMAVNVTGSFLCARAAARHMLPRHSGSIVNLASMLGFSGGLFPNPVYATSKGAVVNMTRTLALEWAAAGVRVNAVGPTYIRTSLTQALIDRPEVRARIEEATPMHKIGEPEDVVGAILYLASPAASLVTGHTLVVDGGFLAR